MDGKTRVCDKRDGTITCEFCGDLHLAVMFSDLYKRIRLMAKGYFKQNFCHACHIRFAVFVPLPSCCVSSL